MHFFKSSLCSHRNQKDGSRQNKHDTVYWHVIINFIIIIIIDFLTK